MNTYTLHVPADARPGDPRALDHAVLVRDGFTWGAFLFTFFWFFVHRLWLAGLMVLVAVVGLAALLATLGVRPGAAFAAELLLSLLIGLEAGALRRWTYRRRKPAVDVVSAGSLEEAETKSFARWVAREASGPLASPPPPATSYRAPEPVIGLFPEAVPRRS
jgi:hypothetical protein